VHSRQPYPTIADYGIDDDATGRATKTTVFIHRICIDRTATNTGVESLSAPPTDASLCGTDQQLLVRKDNLISKNGCCATKQA
jgi:hypothetical protein